MAMLGSGRQLLVEWLFRAENGSYGRRRSMSIFGLPYRPHVSKQPTPVTWSALHGDSELLQSCSAAEADIPGGATKGASAPPKEIAEHIASRNARMASKMRRFRPRSRLRKSNGSKPPMFPYKPPTNHPAAAEPK
jgi:hypothetical protein